MHSNLPTPLGLIFDFQFHPISADALKSVTIAINHVSKHLSSMSSHGHLYITHVKDCFPCRSLLLGTCLRCIGSLLQAAGQRKLFHNLYKSNAKLLQIFSIRNGDFKTVVDLERMNSNDSVFHSFGPKIGQDLT